jgi:uncharacterized protein
MAIPASELWSQIQRDLSGKSNVEQIAILKQRLQDWPSEWKGPYRELQQKLRRLLSKLASTETVKTGAGQRDPFYLPREGHAQFALLGLPNSGKSALVATLTSARTQVTDYPFATRVPIPGSLRYNSAAIQIIDTPAIVASTSHGEGVGPRLLNLVRESDGLGIVVDLSDDLQMQMQVILSELREAKVLPIPAPGSTFLRKRGKGGVVFTGAPLAEEEQDVVRRMLSSGGIQHAEVRTAQNFSPTELDAQIRGLRVLPTIVIGTKSDLAHKASAPLIAMQGDEFAIVSTNFLDEANYDELRWRIFWILGLIRIDVLRKASLDAPKTSVVLKRGTQVGEFTREIHGEAPRAVKVWGAHVKHQGQPVSLQYLLQSDDAIFIDR